MTMLNPRTTSWRAIAAALVAAVGLTMFLAAPDASAGKKKAAAKIKVMTRNVYLGADLGPAIASEDLAGAIDAGGVIYNEVARTDFPARSILLAAEIQSTKPDLIGLQEVALWREQDPSDGGNEATTGTGEDATTVTFDFLKLLMAEINKGPAKYKVVGVQKEFDAELPADTDGMDGTSSPAFPVFGADIDARLTMRDVILVRKGSKVTAKKNTVKKGHYKELFSAPVAGGVATVTALRGWLSVEAKYKKGRKYKPTKFRVVNTHFEAFGDPEIREKQAKELLRKPLKSKGRVVLLGDLNSGLGARHKVFGDDQLAFKAIKNGGYKDLGAVQSCCYPSALDDPLFTFDHTVDHVLANKKAKAKKLKSFITGNDASKRTPGAGLWPSDHGGVVSKLKLAK